MESRSQLRKVRSFAIVSRRESEDTAVISGFGCTVAEKGGRET
jgi:hypothetical protein